jgi:LysR family glycine cleavage system transcriptional activator
VKLSKQLILGLRVFRAVARTQSVAKAAQELNVTPGAISQQIRQLEGLIGTELFHRVGNRLALNDKARSLAMSTDAGFHQISKGVEEVLRRVASTSLRVKLPPTFAVQWLLPRLTSFYALYPDVQLELSTYLKKEDVTLDQADLVVRMGSGQWDDGVAELIFPDELVPVCALDIAKRLIEPADVAKEMLMHSLIRPEAWPMWLYAHHIDPRTLIRGTRFAMAALAFQAAQKGLGIAIAQTVYVRGNLAASGLIVPFPDPVKSNYGFYLVYDKRRGEEKAIRAFRTWIASVGLREKQTSEGSA